MKKNELHFFRLLRDFLTDYLIVKRGFSEKTVRAYRQTMNLMRDYLREENGIRFNQMNFTCFSRKTIYDFLMWLKNSRNNSVATLNLRLASIKSFLKFCGEEDLELMPVCLEAESIHAFKGAKKPSVEYLTQEQLKLLFALPDITTKLGRRNRFFLIFAYETGARIQEILDLRLKNIVRSDHNVRIRIHGKGNKTRYVPLLGSTVAHLDAYLADFHKDRADNAHLFYTIHEAMKTQMKSGAVDYFLKQYGKLAHEVDAAFPDYLHAHMLRHSVAMAMYKKGVPISYIRDFLGHKSIDSTVIYSYADDETISAALESIEHVEAEAEYAVKTKNWKGQEQYLLEYCGLN